VRWTKPAAIALGAIQDYIANENPRAASEVTQWLRIAVNQLEEHPRSGRTGTVRGTYELLIYDLPYIVAYRIMKEEVQILSVYHTSRKWPDKFN
jgi:toxin ParE1/3/4